MIDNATKDFHVKEEFAKHPKRKAINAH